MVTGSIVASGGEMLPGSAPATVYVTRFVEGRPVTQAYGVQKAP